MYGLILEGIATAVREKYGEEAWQAVRQLADVSAVTFRSHKRYSETLVPRLIAAAHKHTGDSCNDLMHTCGHSFVGYIENYGYHRIMSVLGRQLRDFLNGLDNLHEYLRFTYPRMKPPSFFCADECSTGLTLHYRSKRKGYVHYVIGQIQSVAMRYYKTPVTVSGWGSGAAGRVFGGERVPVPASEFRFRRAVSASGGGEQVPFPVCEFRAFGEGVNFQATCTHSLSQTPLAKRRCLLFTVNVEMKRPVLPEHPVRNICLISSVCH